MRMINSKQICMAHSISLNVFTAVKGTHYNKFICLIGTAIRRLGHMSHDVRKPDICICENKDADQLRGNRQADQHLCFRYMDSTISLLPKSEISSL